MAETEKQLRTHYILTNILYHEHTLYLDTHYILTNILYHEHTLYLELGEPFYNGGIRWVLLHFGCSNVRIKLKRKYHWRAHISDLSNGASVLIAILHFDTQNGGAPNSFRIIKVRTQFSRSIVTEVLGYLNSQSFFE